MARFSKCNDCGFIVDNYSATADHEWDNHPCTATEEEEA